jgi:type II secretory pathway component PulK
MTLIIKLGKTHQKNGGTSQLASFHSNLLASVITDFGVQSKVLAYNFDIRVESAEIGWLSLCHFNRPH